MLSRAFLAAMPVAALLSLGAPAAHAAFTWTGLDQTTNTSWNDTRNWSPQTAPSAGNDALTFPAASACSSDCETTDNVAGVVASPLMFSSADGYVVLDSSPATQLEIGTGGLQASAGANDLDLPIEITTSEPNWTLTTSGTTVDLFNGLTALNNTDALGITMAAGTTFFLDGGGEVGPLTITGSAAGTYDTNGLFEVTGDLNGTGGKAVNLDDASLFAYDGVTTGPLTSAGGSIQAGNGDTSGASQVLTVNGPLSLDASSNLQLFAYDNNGSVAGTDYSQVAVNGQAQLSGHLSILLGASNSTCPQLSPGTVLTILTATGGVSGTFTALPNGGTTNLTTSGCTNTGGSSSIPATVTYAADAVNATIDTVSTSTTSTSSATSSASATSTSTTTSATSVATTTTTSSQSTTAFVPPPPPVLYKAVNVVPVSGHVFIKLPPGATLSRANGPLAHSSLTKGEGFLPLTEARQIPVGSILDTTEGTVSITAAASAKRGQTYSGQFTAGIFAFLQDRHDKGLSELDLENSKSRATVCASVGKGARFAGATEAKRLSNAVLGLLEGSDHGGRFSTRGAFSAATVRGTQYSVANTCLGTLTEVKRGSVAVDYFRHHKSIIVKAGHAFLARASGGPSEVVSIGKVKQRYGVTLSALPPAPVVQRTSAALGFGLPQLLA